MILKCLKAVWQFCSYLFVPQIGRNRRKYELQKRNVTYLTGKERAEGNQDELTAEYITQLTVEVIESSVIFEAKVGAYQQ